MKANKILLALATCALTIAAAAAQAADGIKGSWTLSSAKEADKVNFGLFQKSHGHNFHSQNDWPKSAFAGVDFNASGKRDVTFALVRDAGRLDAKGYLDGGEGAGTFGFAPDANYRTRLSALGFEIDEEKQFVLAIHDVSLAYAQEMKAMKLENFDTDKLVAFGIFHVSKKFIEEIRAEGLPATDADKLIAFRVHQITPEYVREVRKAGLKADADQLLAMRIHGATPQWISQMQKDGYADAGIEQLIAFRVHGVTHEYVQSIEKLGFENIDANQLVAMRVHGVTPEYIQKLQTRGLKDLTIDQIVSMKVHGIR